MSTELALIVGRWTRSVHRAEFCVHHSTSGDLMAIQNAGCDWFGLRAHRSSPFERVM
jgi:hypothetical protein